MDAWNHTFTHDMQTVLRRAEEAIALCDEHGFPFWRAGAMVTQGWARAKQGDATSGLKQLREGITGWQATGAQVGVPYFWGLAGETALEAGLLDEAQHAVA